MAAGGKTDLAELLAAHRGIISDRITERKKCATLLRDLLDSNNIIDYITTSTNTQSRNQAVTWSSLFKNVVGYVYKEAEAVAKMEEKSRSSSTLQTKKKDMSDMLRAYLRSSNKRGHHTCVGEVVEHIMTVLRNSKMVVWMCGDYSWILLHYLLQKQHYVVQISAAAWSELISLYTSLFITSSSSTLYDRTLLSRVLLTLFTHSTNQCDVDTATLYNFFAQIMPGIAREKRPKILENILLSFSIYCTSTANNSRGRLCNLGEEVLPDILHMWGRGHTPVELQLLSILRFQMKVHHPCGRHGEDSGGWAANDTLWKKNLEHLYELLLVNFESAAHKLQWSGKGETGLKPEFIDLACDVINQVMYIRNERVSSNPQSPPSTSIQHRDKRLKPQTCWSNIIDSLSTNADSPSLIIWLQLISMLITKWPGCLLTEDTSHLLTQMVKLLADTKRSECLPWLFRCLQVLALHPSTDHTHIPHTSTNHLAHSHSFTDLWCKVWTAALKSVSVRSAEDEVYSLLTAIVEQRLLEPDMEPWKLMNGNINQPRRPLVSFLASLICNHRLPESFGPHKAPPTITPPNLMTSTPSPITPSHTTQSTYPLRVKLLNFLLSTDRLEEDAGVGEVEGGRKTESILHPAGVTAPDMPPTRPSVSLCAHILVALTQRSCSVLQHPHLKKHYLPHSVKDVVCRALCLEQTSIDHVWNDIEQLYLESTFDTPVKVQSTVATAVPVVYCRESPIPALMSFLIELLGNRAENLLKPITLEATAHIRDKVHSLSIAMETQAYHCALVIHILFIVGVVSGWSLAETMRKSLAVKLLPSLLQKVATGLRNPVWNEVERSEYNQTVTNTLKTLTPLLNFNEDFGGKKLSPECMASASFVREVVTSSFPQSILTACLKIVLRKSPLPPQPPSRPSSTFSMTTNSTTSHRPSVTSSSPLSPSPTPSLPQSSSCFDDDMDIGTENTDSTTLGDTAQTSLTDLLPRGQSSFRMEAAAFIVHWYQLTTVAPHPGGVVDQNGTFSTRGEENFDPEKALLSMLNNESIQISKETEVKIVFYICCKLTSCDRIIRFLEPIMEVISQVLMQHRKSQSVLCESLKLLEQLARHFQREGEGKEEGGSSRMESLSLPVSYLKQILSAFWSLYVDKALSASVRLQLASTLCSFLTTAVESADDLKLSIRKRKRSDSSPTDGIPISEAILLMIDDPDHAVRMHMAKVVTSLHLVAGSNQLVSREEQVQFFHQVLDMVKKAHLISMDQDDLSREDDSVNRVASLITTLQYQACVSPVCESAVLSELIVDVGRDFMDEELVSKALHQVSRYLGYPSTRSFLDDHLLSMLGEWLDKDELLDKFPHRLFGETSKETFFIDRAEVIVPFSVYRCDETALRSLATLISSSLPSLLSNSIASSMALILPSFAQQDSRDSEAVSEERRTKAHASNDLLTRHLSKEEIDESMKTKMVDFVIHLLFHLCEPHTATSHLARYSNGYDPEVVYLHFSSFAIRATLDYIASCYGGTTTTTFIKQLSRKRDNIQKVLLALAIAMETTHRLFKRRQLMQSYALFVSLVSDELDTGLEGIVPFVVMDIVHTVVRLLNNEKKKMMDNGGRGINEKMTSLCFHVLTTLVQAAHRSCPEELGRHLQVVVTTLVSFAQELAAGAVLNNQAMQLLSLLILTPPQSHTLTLHLSQLDPLPHTTNNSEGLFHKFHEQQQMFREAADQLSLEQEINRFIKAGGSLPISTRAPGLQRLTNMIMSCRSDVVELLHSENKPVLNLIQVLVGVASCPVTTPTVTTEMGRYLGELGGLDLNCITLPAATSLSGEFDHTSLPNSWNPLTCCTAHILFLLSSLLKDNDISVVQASSVCLSKVLATKSGAAVLSKVEDMYTWAAFLQPFKPPKKGAPQQDHTPPASTVSIDTQSLWIPQYHHGNSGDVAMHEAWITRLVTALLDSGGVMDQVLLAVRPVCQVKVSFCESIFPYLILNLLWDNDEVYRPIISQHFRHFFAAAATGLSPSSPSPTQSIHSSLPYSFQAPPPPTTSTMIMLNTIMFMRTINRPKLKKSTLWDNNFWLDLDFLDVAMAAQRCSAYFTSLLYIEIWHGSKSNSLVESLNSEDEAAVSTVTQTGLTSSVSLEDPNVQQLLLEAYGNIGEPDSLYGVCASKTVSKETWMKLYEQEGDWEKSLSAYNLQMYLPNPNCQARLVGCLKNLGLTHVLNMYLTGVGVTSPQSMQNLSRFQYEAAWRCSVWEDQYINTLAQPGGGYTGYHRHLCDSLLALRDGESSLLANSLTSARMELLGSLCGGCQEGCSRIYRCLSQLLCLSELEEAGRESGGTLQFLNTWQDRLKYLDADFIYTEPVLSLRASILHSLIQRERIAGAGTCDGDLGQGEDQQSMMGRRRKVERLFVALSNTLLTLAKKAQDVERYQVAEGALFSLHRLHNSRTLYSIPESLYPSLSWKHQLQEAKLYWGRGESSLALGQLRGLLQKIKTLSDPPLEVSSLYPSALCLFGCWLAHTHSENPSVIMKEYLELSVTLMEKQQTSDMGPILHAYLMLARYADSQYQRVTRHMTSTAYETKKQLLEKSQLELEKLSETISKEAQLRNRHFRTLKTQIEEDEIAMSGLIEDRQQFLEKALYNYIHCLRTGDEHDLRVFRLCALWFANANHPKVNTIITEGSAQLESRKFLPLLYQLAARMSSRSLATDPFQHTLQEIIFRTSVDHPHHSLYVTLALSHASMDDTFPATGHVTGQAKGSRGASRLTKKSSIAAKSTVDEDKVKAAKDLIRRLHTEKPSLVHSMERLCEAYIDLAYHDVSALRKERKPIKFPASCTLIKLGGQLKDVVIPTVDIEVDPGCSYDNLVTIDRFDSHFQLAGGVNLPKILSCMGSDGKRRKQLVKGKDDLRQDAVMQQVFVLVNRLLQKEHTTSKRKLNIRTYKVVPLSQRSGIVEWCEDTIPMGEYLVGPQAKPFTGAHYRYRPGDWMSLECRRKLMEAGSKRGQSKFDTYAEITRHFRPVFHHFFMERFPYPSEWFERRLLYTRSVATSSIVGYVVGLGDRHVQNILIDTNTAEFIHIDLGVAFEQGKTLPTPETVPFRLTRDIVDGMGVAGVEGVFRRSCEKTMEVMRASHEELRTIVEVLLYDPLYMWTISPVKALNLQRRGVGDDSSATGATGDQIFEGGGGGGVGNGLNPTNKMAERVLLRLQEKLEGIEDGVPLSVNGQVNQLIQEATDPSNLCLLFPGWQAWI